MKKAFLFVISFVVLTTFSSFENKAPKSKFNQDNHANLSMKKWDIAFYVSVSASYNYDGCIVTITATIVFFFNESTYQLTGVGLSGNYNIEIDCTGPPIYYARRGSEVTFDINSHEVTNVNFPVTGNRVLDKLFSDTSFKQWFIDLTNNNNPK